MFNLFKPKKNNDPVPSVLPFNMDIHSHILPGIDDGSPNIETSLELIEGLCSLGIKKTIATPHIISDLYRNTPTIINNVLYELQKACRKKGLSIEISAAAEYMIDDYFLDLLQQQEPLLTLHENLILTEIPFTANADNLENVIALIIDNGYKPILAHPERYHYFQKRLDDYFYLKKIGFTLQVNLLSLIGYYGEKEEKAAKFILKNNLATLVGTDMHHHRHLAEILDEDNRREFKGLLNGRKWNDLDTLSSSI
jgi:protein-tyrosine phosphatase